MNNLRITSSDTFKTGHVNRLVRDINILFGKFYRQSTPDRDVIENVILPYLADNDAIRRLVSIGTDWYTAWYHRLFDHKEFWTIEPVWRNRLYGSRRHRRGYMSEMGRWFAPESVDCILCNGVLGFGLNAVQDVENSFKTALGTLKPAGTLIVGWNDTPKWRVCNPAELASLEVMSPWIFPPLGVSEYLVASDPVHRHTYSFFMKG